ncbi:hypothetical protein HHI36_001046 [Cryptolaemus montrouzieri]|uniref:RRM domain-containing protein n=1 Tax=Cryptolaemus montrouzieri TaxID=559131 RepID=A0ABD2P7C3_9CUCU
MEEEDSRTVWCGNLSDNVTEELLYELFLQAAPLERVRIPQDRGGRRANYAFITFKHTVSVPYVVELLNGISIFDKNLNIKPRQKNQINEVSSRKPNVRDRLGMKTDDPCKVPIPSPLNTSVFEEMGNVYFQNLLQMGPTMNVAAIQNNYMSSVDNRYDGHRDIRMMRDYRREEHNPYGRNMKHSRKSDSNYGGHRRRRY